MEVAAVRFAWVSIAARGSPGGAAGVLQHGEVAGVALRPTAPAPGRRITRRSRRCACRAERTWSPGRRPTPRPGRPRGGPASPSASKASACGSMVAKSGATRMRAPLSASLLARTRGGSSGLRCTTCPPARSVAKKPIGWYGTLGRNNATGTPGPTPRRRNPAAARSTAAPNSRKLDAPAAEVDVGAVTEPLHRACPARPEGS